MNRRGFLGLIPGLLVGIRISTEYCPDWQKIPLYGSHLTEKQFEKFVEEGMRRNYQIVRSVRTGEKFMRVNGRFIDVINREAGAEEPLECQRM